MKKIILSFIMLISVLSFSDEYYGGIAEEHGGHYEYVTETKTEKEAKELYQNKVSFAKKRDNLITTQTYKNGRVTFFEEYGIGNSYYFILFDGKRMVYSTTDIPKNFGELSKLVVKNKNINTKKNNSIKIYEFDNKFLKSEFDKNEPRALHKFGGRNNKFLINGKIKKLDSGAFDDRYIIILEDYTSIYIKKESKQIELYFDLNKGDQVYLIASGLRMSFGELIFDFGNIENEVSFYSLKKNAIIIQ